MRKTVCRKIERFVKEDLGLPRPMNWVSESKYGKTVKALKRVYHLLPHNKRRAYMDNLCAS